MHRGLLRSWLVVLTIGGIAAGTADVQAQGADASDLDWLAGCWQMRAAGVVIEEHWMPERSGVLLGVSRTTRSDSIVGFEFMRIYSRADTLVFAVQPSGQAPTEFRSRSTSEREVVFENAGHDFPQRVQYRAVGADSLIGRIEGVRGGVLRAVDFPYARTQCVPGYARTGWRLHRSVPGAMLR